MQVFWLEAHPWDRAAGAAVTVRACNVALSQAALIDGSPAFIDVLADGPTISTQVFDGAFTGRTNVTVGSIPLNAGQGDIDYWAALAWADRPVKIWTATVNGLGDLTNLAGTTLIWEGVTEAFDPGLMTATLSLRVSRPSGKLASGVYAGTGGREGRQEIVGAVRPYADGALLNRPAVLLDSGKGLYQVVGYANGSAIAVIREGYRALDQTRVAQASAAALVAATVPAGEIHTFAAEGLFRIGFQPVADITADFTTTGSARPGALIQRALLHCGWPIGKIDTASLAAIDAALPYDAWIYDDQGADIADKLDEFCRDIGGYWDVTELGVFYAGIVKRQAPVMTIGPRGQLLDQDYQDIDQLVTQPPFWRNRVGYAFNARTFTAAELGVQIAATTADWSAIVDDGGKPEDGATRNVNRGAWAAGTSYQVGDFFLYDSNSYSVIADHLAAGGSPPPNANVQLFVAGGGAGAAGVSSARVLIFRRAPTTPILPGDPVTFTFATGGLAGLNNGWSLAVPAADGNPLWVSGASASSAAATDTIAPGEWAAPVIQTQDGAAGAAGINTATIYLFKRTSSSVPPAAPAGAITYTFASSALSGSLDGWSTSLPTSGGSFRWVITATALAAAPTDTIPSAEWAAASLLAQDGDEGDPGADALQLSAEPAALTVACDANGVPKTGQLPKYIQFRAVRNTADVTTTTTFSYFPTGCNITDNGGGQISIDEMLAAEASVIAVGANMGQTGRFRATANKVRDGFSAASTVDDVTVTTSGSPTLVSSVTLGVGPGGNVQTSTSVSYSPVGGAGAASSRVAGQMFYRVLGSGTWIAMGSEVLGSVATRAADIAPGEPGEVTPGALNFAQTVAGPTSPANWEFGLFLRNAGSTNPSGGGNFAVSFNP